MNTNEIVSKLWKLCDILRDDGITYHQYVTELSYLLFLKLMAETGDEDELPEGYRWNDLSGLTGVDQHNYYRELLVHLGTHGSDTVRAIFTNSNSSLRQPVNLERLVKSIDSLQWYSADKEDLGDMYEGLLQKNASEKKSGAGQYFTPRPLIECMVRCIRPQPGEVIQDPAAGTGGFLIAADRFIKAATNGLYDLPQADQDFHYADAFHAVELVPEAHRLLLMNCLLHGVSGHLHNENTLASFGDSMEPADVILTNPPFGTAKGGKVTREFTYVTSNKQLCFLQHIYRGLKPGGRTAVVLPDNVLFEEGTGTRIRADLMDKCNLHTILRLPTGIFYAQGVKTNVLFFTRGATDTGNTQHVWVYDLRTNMPSFGVRTPLTHSHFEDFENAYGKRPDGSSQRTDQGETGRFSCFTREQIAARGDNLDISWLKDDDVGGVDELPDPEEIASQIRERLSTALEEMDALVGILEGDTSELEDTP